MFEIRTILLHEITKKEFFFEKIKAYFHIEFQKRGKPHAHIILILKEKYKIQNAKDIDIF